MKLSGHKSRRLFDRNIVRTETSEMRPAVWKITRGRFARDGRSPGRGRTY
jgi:hypothetical protein